MSGKVTVIAHATAKKGKEKDFERVARALLKPTRAEKGCLNYDLHQSTENPDAFVFHENWTTLGALEAHLKTQHIALFKTVSAKFLAEPVKITLWKEI